MRLRQKRLFGIIVRPDLEERLEILSEDSRFDLAGSCAKDPLGRGRKRGNFGRWVYPVVLPDGRRMNLFRILLSNVCLNDCAYCPLRVDEDSRRVSLSPRELARAFIAYWRKGLVQGLFLSSGVVKDPDTTMKLLIKAAQYLRQKEKFYGYIHLKVIPGASEAAVEEAARLASALSLNLEAPDARSFVRLSQRKSYENIISLTSYLSRLKSQKKFSHTTQLVVGAAGERDAEIIRTTEVLYKRFGLNRVYFAAYQPGFGRPHLPGEKIARKIDLRTREHRLYQVDFLLRKYGFRAAEIPLKDGFLSLEEDPKTLWARAHPEFFPLHLKKASYHELLRVPGIGPVTAQRIIRARKEGVLIDFSKIFPNQKLLARALPYLVW